MNNNMPELKPGMAVLDGISHYLFLQYEGSHKASVRCFDVLDNDLCTIPTSAITEVRECYFHLDESKIWERRPTARTITLHELIRSHEEHTGEKVKLDVRGILDAKWEAALAEDAERPGYLEGQFFGGEVCTGFRMGLMCAAELLEAAAGEGEGE